MPYTLTLIDVRRVQNYLFNANELKQNLGASDLVEQTIHDFILDELTTQKSNFAWDKKQYRLTFNGQTIHRDGLPAQVLFIGGGNAAILFDKHDRAIEFTQKYTRTVLERAPGLEVAVGHVDVDWSQPGALRQAWDRLQREIMPARKEGRAVPQALLGLGVTAECAFTGLPAVAEVFEPNEIVASHLVSAESLAKTRAVEEARWRLNTLLPPRSSFEYPDRLDHLGGEKGRASYIAVIHADGNGIGERIKAYLAQEQDNDRLAEKMGEFSQAINTLGLRAMQAVCSLFQSDPPTRSDRQGLLMRDRWNTSEIVRFRSGRLPLRPIIFGGDDVTFVCEGRLGLALAVKFLEAFSQISLPDGETAHACAGVAIVHTHYPFARAYALAEELCQEAKQHARGLDKNGRVSLINWHSESSGLTLSWDDIKEREYKAGTLLARPLVVASQTPVSTWKTWQTFTRQVQAFRQEWKWGRNKLKDLQESLRQGPDAVKQFVHLYGSLPDLGLSELEPGRQTGWIGDTSIYFDALEANDLFIYPEEAQK